MDTWHILEQRFHDIGNRDHDVAMTFEKVDDEKYWYSLHGPGQKYEGDGVWRITLVGAPKNGLPVLEKEHYSVEELEETLLRAGRLLNKDEGRNDRDAAGAYRFVKLLVKQTIFCMKMATTDSSLMLRGSVGCWRETLRIPRLQN